MPKRTAVPIHALTAVGVRNLKTPGRHADGGGLYLHIRNSGSKNWLLRIMAQGKRRDIGLGVYPDVSLAEAREAASAARKIARSGGNPIVERNRDRVYKPTFAEAARIVFEARKATWKNPKHRAQWISTLETYAFPHIGDRRVDHIETGDVLRVLSPIWLAKPETARRLRQRIGTVLDWARAAGHRDGENPIVGVSQGLPKQPEAGRKHHAAMAYDDVPDFVRDRLPSLSIGMASRLALEFLILTAARTSEVLEADWAEVDPDAEVWTVPGARMKAGKDHRVPLSRRAVAILLEAKALSDGSGYIFPGAKAGRPMSNMALAMALRRAEIDVTVHGFRSSFRDWAAERSNVAHEVVEAALAHAVDDKVVAAYRRTDFFEKRRELMQAWSDFVTMPKGTVVPLASAVR